MSRFQSSTLILTNASASLRKSDTFSFSGRRHHFHWPASSFSLASSNSDVNVRADIDEQLAATLGLAVGDNIARITTGSLIFRLIGRPLCEGSGSSTIFTFQSNSA